MDALKPTLILTLIAALVLGACSRTDVTPMTLAVASVRPADSPKPVYPRLQPDAQDGQVFDYY